MFIGRGFTPQSITRPYANGECRISGFGTRGLGSKVAGHGYKEVESRIYLKKLRAVKES